MIKKTFVALLSLLMILIPLSIDAYETVKKITLNTPIVGTYTGSQPDEIDKEKISMKLQQISQSAIDAFKADRPDQRFWIDIEKCNFSYSIEYNKGSYTVSSLSVRLVSGDEFYDPLGMTEAMNEIIDGFVPTGTTMYDIVKSIHDFVAEKAVYDKDAEFRYTAFGALVEGRAVCEGYAEAFKIICDRNGIPCICVTGVGNSEEHMWNYVRMDDGKWYAVDVTWDDTSKLVYSYFLVGSETKVTKKKNFSDNHRADGDLSNTGFMIFEYPELSESAYEQSGKEFERQSAVTDYYLSQLDANQTRCYNVLNTATPPRGSKPYVVTDTTDTPVPSTAEETEPPSSEPEPSKKETFEPEATVPVTPQEQETAETEPSAETDETDYSSDAAESVTAGSTVSDSLSLEYSESTAARLTAVTEMNGTDTESGSDYEKAKSVVSYILNVIVIVSALILIFLILALVLIRFASSDRKG